MTTLRLALACALTFAYLMPAVAHTPAVMRTRALVLSAQARKAYDAGKFERAANLYRLAAQADADEPTYLWGVGKSEQMAGRCPMADKAFTELRARLPTGHALLERVAKAEGICHPPPPPDPPRSVVVVPIAVAPTPTQELEPVLRPEPTALVQTPVMPEIAVVKPRQRESQVPWTLWAGIGAGVAAAATGAWAGWAFADLDGQVGHMSPADARERQVTINGVSTATAILGALAIAGVGHGVLSYLHAGQRD